MSCLRVVQSNFETQLNSNEFPDQVNHVTTVNVILKNSNVNLLNSNESKKLNQNVLNENKSPDHNLNHNGINDNDNKSNHTFEIVAFQVQGKGNKKESRKHMLTNEEYQLIVQSHHKAKNLNVESIFQKHYSHIIEYRNMTFTEAKKNNITYQSNDIERLQYIGKVVEYTYFNIEPPDEYTKITDRKHFKEVAVNAVRLCKKQKKTPCVELIICCWLHDIERFIPHIKCEYLPEHIDEYRKEIIHPLTSARVALALLNGAPLSSKEKSNIFELISQHDKPTDIQVVANNMLLLDTINEELKDTLETLMDADSFAFFQSMSTFILFKCKSNTREWIWKRIVNNLKRLRHDLREDAVKLILALPNHLMQHIAFDNNQLIQCCKSDNKKDAGSFNIGINENKIYDNYINVATNNTSLDNDV